MAVTTEYPHIILDEQGTPTIQGTSLKVIELITERLAYGWSPEELHLQHPYLSLSQVHAALAYYWDHAGELDQGIAKRLKSVDKLGKIAKQQSLLLARLKAQGLL